MNSNRRDLEFEDWHDLVNLYEHELCQQVLEPLGQWIEDIGAFCRPFLAPETLDLPAPGEALGLADEWDGLTEAWQAEDAVQVAFFDFAALTLLKHEGRWFLCGAELTNFDLADLDWQWPEKISINIFRLLRHPGPLASLLLRFWNRRVRKWQARSLPIPDSLAPRAQDFIQGLGPLLGQGMRQVEKGLDFHLRFADSAGAPEFRQTVAKIDDAVQSWDLELTFNEPFACAGSDPEAPEPGTVSLGTVAQLKIWRNMAPLMLPIVMDWDAGQGRIYRFRFAPNIWPSPAAD